MVLPQSLAELHKLAAMPVGILASLLYISLCATPEGIRHAECGEHSDSYWSP